MATDEKRPIFVGLVHYPVVNRRGEPVTSAITNLDIHDIARTCRTYDVKSFYIINPANSQKELLEDIISYWIEGAGARSNPERNEAFKVIRHAPFIKDAIEDIGNSTLCLPEVWATSAKDGPARLPWHMAQKRVYAETQKPLFILFGTGGGLANEVFLNSDFIIAPIKGKKGYNHLSVRSAIAITLDRLLTRRM